MTSPAAAPRRQSSAPIRCRSSVGRPVRDTISSLVERTGGDLEARFATGAGETARDLCSPT